MWRRRIIVTATTDFCGRAIGVELRKDLVEKAEFEVKRRNPSQIVKVMHGDFSQ